MRLALHDIVIPWQLASYDLCICRLSTVDCKWLPSSALEPVWIGVLVINMDVLGVKQHNMVQYSLNHQLFCTAHTQLLRFLADVFHSSYIPMHLSHYTAFTRLFVQDESIQLPEGIFVYPLVYLAGLLHCPVLIGKNGGTRPGRFSHVHGVRQMEDGARRRISRSLL